MAFILKVSSKWASGDIPARFRACSDVGEKLRWQAVMLKKEGRSAKEIASICGRNVDWVRRTVRKFSEEGPDALVDGPRSKGRAGVLDEEGKQALAAAIEGPAPNGDLWTSQKGRQLDRRAHRDDGLRAHRLAVPAAAGLLTADTASQAPRRERGGPAGLQKGGLQGRVADLVREHPDAEVEVWAEDEGRFGRNPTTRRVWARRGRRPLASSKRRYEWAYLYSFVHPNTGRTVHFVGSTVSSAAMSAVLKDFAEAVGAGPKKRVVVVLDGAGWHQGKDVVPPDGVHLELLPPYSPELQPAERIWPLIHEVIANRAWPDMTTLAATISTRCNHLSDHPELIRGRTAYLWWLLTVERGANHSQSV